MKALSILILLCFTFGSAFAYEPDVTQQRQEHDPALRKVHHLIPSGTMPPEEHGPPLRYLARFSRSPPFHEDDAYEWALVHKERSHVKEHKYLLSSWRLDRSDRSAGHRRIDAKEIEIPRELAATIYSMWANAILNARYARQAMALDGTSYWFSTSLTGVGWLSATTWEPAERSPPGWLVSAGEQVLALARAERPDANQVHASLRALQSRLREHPG
jgi:hypothetical protein